MNDYQKATVLSAKTLQILDQYGQRKEQKVKLRLTDGPETGKTVEITNNSSVNGIDFDYALAPGDKVLVFADHRGALTTYYFYDFDRLPYFLFLLGIFVFGLLFWGRIVGLKSIIALGISLFFLWHFFSVALVPTNNIYFISLLFCAAASLFVLLTVGGNTDKTWAALAGTWGGLAFAGLLSYFSIQWMHLSGLGNEPAFSLKASIAPQLDLHGVLFASMIIASLGAIMDVTVSIASAQFELYQSSPEITWRELYRAGMNVGKDIMGAMSNTLVLAYVGSSLPLLLLIVAEKQQLAHILNTSVVITELTRAIVGSIGLIGSVPLTAITMSVICCRKRNQL
ncbi:YibE/F family protein [Lucifera butyrica]|nr:YibE/F family protein [Lucifera butyrica]